jgi:hypothetical protein
MMIKRRNSYTHCEGNIWISDYKGNTARKSPVGYAHSVDSYAMPHVQQT